MATTTLTGTTGNDILNSPGSVTTLVAGYQGNDTITLALVNDESNAGAGNDSIILNATGTVANTINGGSGNDSVQAPNSTLVNSVIGLGDGNDTINITAAQLIGGSYGGNGGSDRIVLNGGLLNSVVGGGKNADSINIQGGTTNVTLFGGGGADTINLAAAQATTLTTIQSGDGHDRILASAIAGASTLIIAGGKGLDSIGLGTTQVGTVAGGANDDTISFGAATFNGGTLFGDGLGVITGSTGGNDLFQITGAAIGSAASIYGAGGADTINLGGAAAQQLQIDGGDAADLISNTAANAGTTAATILGGNGADTISMLGMGGAGVGLTTILGAAGHDSIFVGTNGGLGSVDGGAGNDTITWRGALATTTSYAAIGTIDGGSGTDLIIAGRDLAGGLLGSALSAAAGSAANGFAANIQYVSGDTIQMNTTACSTATINVLQANGAVYLQSLMSASISASLGAGYASAGGLGLGGRAVCSLTGQLMSAGSVSVFDTNGLGVAGGDLVVGFYNGVTSLNTFVRIVGGDVLVTSTTGGVVSETNVNATFASTGGNISMTLG